MEHKDVVIVGSGPAGVATALALDKIDPEIAQQTVVLEARRHPREKVCAGCVTGRGLNLFKSLGVDLTAPHVCINSVRFRTAWGDLVAHTQKYGVVVRRSEFDATVAAELPRREITLREGTRLKSLSDNGTRIVAHTTNGDIAARAIVGADGVGSVVRRYIEDVNNSTLLTQAEIEIGPDHPSHAEKRIEFDFRKVPDGRRGYRWIFPYIENGKTHVNVGICERNGDGAVELKNLLKTYMESEGLDHKNARFRFFPERSYNPEGIFCAPGMLLVGDAAGIDPFLGEGLSYSVEYGILAAETIVKAIKNNDFSFSEHGAKVKRSRLGMTLSILNLIAKHFYGPLHERLVKNGLMDPQISRDIGDFLAGRIQPTVAMLLKIAYKLAYNTCIPSAKK